MWNSEKPLVFQFGKKWLSLDAEVIETPDDYVAFPES